MDETDKKRFNRSIEYALKFLQQDAHCFCYEDEAEYKALVTIVKEFQKLLNTPVK